jgi:DEAD/DEAH box helicase domain-containing protein
MLQLDVRGSERDDTFKTSKSYRSQAPAHDASVGGWTGNESLDDYRRKTIGDGDLGKEVLFFEFIDGDLKRQVQDKKTGEPVRPTRKLREEQLKMPIYGQKQMTQLIERRNQKFANAINVFLNQCVAEKVDPDITLKHLAQAFIPKPSLAEKPLPEVALSTIPADIPKERKSIPDIVQELKESSWYTGQIVPDGHRVFEPQVPIYGDLEFLLTQNLVNALYNAKGISRFYAHQAEALNKLYEGHNIVVATSTSSGKSLIYQLPVLYALEKDYNARAMYIFPTKALAQDQKRSLNEMMAYMPGLEDTIIETFDGDTPMNERSAIREEGRIIFTNPDMLHITILPQEERWRSFLKNLKYVVGMYEPTREAWSASC